MRTAALTIRHTVPGVLVAYSVWLVSGSVVIVKHGVNDPYVNVQRIQGAPIAKPGVNAQFLVSYGIPALDTADGFHAFADVWESEPGLFCVATDDGLEWSFAHSEAALPVNGRSRLTGASWKAQGQVIALRSADVSGAALDAITLRNAQQFGGLVDIKDGELSVDETFSRVDFEAIDKDIDNHRSVSFGAQSSTTLPAPGAATVNFSHTAQAQANSYIAGMSGHRGSQNISNCDYNGAALAGRRDENHPARAEWWDRPLGTPDGAAHTLTFNFSATTVGGMGAVSAYGVDQSNPVSENWTPTFAISTTPPNTTPSITGASAADELAITLTCWVCTPETNTPDASWTTDFNNPSGAAAPARGAAVSHIAGAASLTRTDTLSAAQEWTCIGGSLREPLPPGLDSAPAVSMMGVL